MKKNIVLGVIPARYKSSRFPGKPLVDILGMSMIERVYKQCCKAKQLDDVCVATDDLAIFEHVQSFGGNVFMTNENHPSGTDRCLEAAILYSKKHKDSELGIIVNIQGDEPLIAPENINIAIEAFEDSETQITTLATEFKSTEQLQNPNTVKITFTKSQNALYFSRSIIPFVRNSTSENLIENFNFLKHIGLYAYRFDVLKEICKLSESSLEKIEMLEQLRWLENDYKVKIVKCESEGLCVDVPSDLIPVIEAIRNNKK